MRRVRFSLLIGLLAGSMLLLAGCDSGGSNGGDEDDESSTVTELADENDKLETLASAVKAAGLDDDLDAEDKKFTVFAPTDNAFSSIEDGDLKKDKSLVQKVLKYHVIVGKEITSGDISDNQSESTFQGGDLTFSVSGGNVKVNGAMVTTADVQASNGVVHLIDGVLLDKANTAERASITPNLNTLTTALGATGQDQTLNDSKSTFTVFAPSDAAFTPYDVNFLTKNTSLLSTVLDYHVVKGSAVTSGQLSDGQTINTLQGDITVSVGNNIFLGEGGDEDAQVTTADVETNNGVVHIVDDVLLTDKPLGTPLQRLEVNKATQTLRDQLEKDQNLASTFNSSTWTTFAPSNQAFQNADLSNLSDQQIKEILQYHTLPADPPIDSEALTQALSNDSDGQITRTTNQGEDVTIKLESDGSIVLNPSSQNSATLNLNRVDQRASSSNGSIIHQIDGVLLPPSFSSN